MNRNGLYNELVKMVPVKSDEKKDFLEVVRGQLKAYRKLLSRLTVEVPAEWEGTKTNS